MHIGGTTQSSTTLPGGSVVPGDFNVSGDLDVATGHVGIGAVSNTLSALYIHENDSSEGNTQLHIHNNKADDAAVLRLEGKRTSTNDVGQMLFVNNNQVAAKIDSQSAADDGNLRFFTSETGTGNVISQKLEITTDGRGLSQFTAKAWVNYKGLGGNTVRDSHNVSSVTDNNAGRYTINFANAMANVNYVPLNGNVGYQMNVGDNRFFQVVSSQSTTTLGISNVMAQNGFNYTDADYVFIAIFGD
jgi:hypothetical protein